MIDFLPHAAFLLAARLDRPRANFDREWIFLAGLAMVLALILLLSHWSARRRERDFWFDSPARMFRELCRAHRLDWADRRLMQRLGATRGIDKLSEFFVEPNLLDDADLSRGTKASTQDLQHRLFG